MPKKANFSKLSSSDRDSLNKQIDKMIESKYQFINYNGLRTERYKTLTNDYKTNIFDNKVVIIDEVHNFISRIVNKLNSKDKKALFVRMYYDLMDAKNAKIVLLTGTPVVNYPNEIGILFNILRGYIYSYDFTIEPMTTKKVDEEFFRKMFKRIGVVDHIEYSPSSKILSVTRNPYGFISKFDKTGVYKGVERNEQGDVVDILPIIKSELTKNDINVASGGKNRKEKYLHYLIIWMYSKNYSLKVMK